MMRILLRVTKGKEGLCTVVVLVLEVVNVKIISSLTRANVRSDY